MLCKKGIPYIIDVEASGFGEESYPIEIGVILNDESKYCSLVHPQPDWLHWDDSAEEIHGISRELLFEYGRPVTEVADYLNKFLSGMTVFSDGWVVDKPWLNKLFYAAGKSMTFSVSPLEIVLSETQMEHWHLTKKKIFEETKLDRHRASNDAWIIQETYRQTLKIATA